MKVVFSRHAARRARLYDISEQVAADILSRGRLRQGENILVKEVAGHQYPIKIIAIVEGGTATVVTVYPLKKGRRK